MTPPAIVFATDCTTPTREQEMRLMAKRNLDRHAMTIDEDWEGNNAAFKCPRCGKVFIVSGQLHPKGRPCPECGQSKGYVKGGRKKGGKASIKWNDRRVHQAVEERV